MDKRKTQWKGYTMNMTWVTAKKIFDKYGNRAAFMDVWDLALSKREAFLVWKHYNEILKSRESS